MSTCKTFMDERIAATKLAIIAYEAAAMSLGSGVQSYMLDTGQTQQKVTRVDIADIQRTIDSLYNRLSTLCARATGSNAITMRPDW